MKKKRGNRKEEKLKRKYSVRAKNGGKLEGGVDKGKTKGRKGENTKKEK